MPYGFQRMYGGDERARRDGGGGDHLLRVLWLRCRVDRAEETRNPARDLVRGILGSMIVCTIIYIGVAAAALGAHAVHGVRRQPGAACARAAHLEARRVAANLIAAAAIVALPTVILTFLYGQTRIFFVMARDGLLPPRLGGVERAQGTPVAMTIATAIIVSLIADIFPLARIVELANAGTLAAFIAVSCCVMAIRVLGPTRPRVFRVPLVWVVGPLAMLGCIYLFWNLQEVSRAVPISGMPSASRCTSCTHAQQPHRQTAQGG